MNYVLIVIIVLYLDYKFDILKYFYLTIGYILGIILGILSFIFKGK